MMMMSPTKPPIDCQEHERSAIQVLFSMSRVQTKNGTKVNYLSLDDEDVMVDFVFKALKEENEWSVQDQARRSADTVLIDDVDVAVAAASNAAKEQTDFTAPVAANFPTQEPFTLYHENDVGSINDIHTIFRREILEGFFPNKKTGLTSPRDDNDDKAARRSNGVSARFAGCMAFRCRFCKRKGAKKRALMSTVYPQSIEGIYRAFLRFQDKHFDSCPYIPEDIKMRVKSLKNSKGGVSRGKKNCWETSALKKGLRNSTNGKKGIVFCSPVAGEW